MPVLSYLCFVVGFYPMKHTNKTPFSPMKIQENKLSVSKFSPSENQHSTFNSCGVTGANSPTTPTAGSLFPSLQPLSSSSLVEGQQQRRSIAFIYGNSIQCLISGRIVSGVIYSHGEHRGKTVIDFTDREGNPRFCYLSQITQINERPII